ncbi:PREDICTED: LOB domain-containing protein 27-like isoform X2 [Ipomoea nil]|uniref:LOB domain-containing protein 27-like isoform X2 n=1 Tax=Ipomoea nil TaxID=35883 RepID=UPI0009015DA0|nr:PREDICTED: LOB domain-containing protein 27-like isoform X2 [Ipomoea nil]
MTVKGGNSQACAACKHQRRKCSSDCALAQYFPATQPKTFQNAHRLFGVSNILKTLKNIDDDDKKADAMKSIIFEANMRHRFPVHGCVEYICYLRHRLSQAEDELRCVRGQLERCREQLLKSMDSNDDNCSDGGYGWTDVLSSDRTNLSSLDPISCAEYNDLSSALIFPHENFPDYYGLIPGDEPATKEASNSSSVSSSQTDLRNAAAGG